MTTLRMDPLDSRLVDETITVTTPKYHRIMQYVENELYNACKNYPKFNSLHEAYAVLQEEVDEFWDEVKAKPAVRAERKVQTRKELIQIAAMAVRTIVDCID